MRQLSSRKELRMSKKIVKQIRASVSYLSELKATSPPEIQKVVDESIAEIDKVLAEKEKDILSI